MTLKPYLYFLKYLGILAFKGDATYYRETRHRKALKILAVLRYWWGNQLKDKTCLDVGCKTGEITVELSRNVKRIVGIDIDMTAINTAKQQYKFLSNVSFFNESALDLQFASDFFDVVICNHVYEHVSEPQKMMDEIYRVLKPGGGCYFAAVNKAMSWWHGKPMYYGQLEKIVGEFDLHDMTKIILNNPVSFHAEDILNSPFKKRVAKFWFNHFYRTFPVYIWVLKK